MRFNREPYGTPCINSTWHKWNKWEMTELSKEFRYVRRTLTGSGGHEEKPLEQAHQYNGQVRTCIACGIRQTRKLDDSIFDGRYAP